MKTTVLLGITGGIAAYKTPALVRLLVKSDLHVNVIATKSALNFVAPQALATVSTGSIYTDMWANLLKPSIEHIELADSADVAVIAPATANIIAKFAVGIADDLLSTTLVALRCRVLVCPSMNVNMWRNSVVQRNIESLRQAGHHVLTPESGFLACGWTGEGRMPEPEIIATAVVKLLNPPDLKGLRILVTAGPTEEPFDAVRFITNRSSGKMGLAIAQRAQARGADVILVAGPLRVSPPGDLPIVPVRTALEMRHAVMDRFPETDVVIKAAAVADFRPETVSSGKVKKEGMDPIVRLVRNPDILEELGRTKKPKQILVGFAAETDNASANAHKKLVAKNLDLLVLNDVSQVGAGFDSDTNIVRFLYPNDADEQLEIMSKDAVADQILNRVLAIRSARFSNE